MHIKCILIAIFGSSSWMLFVRFFAVFDLKRQSRGGIPHLGVLIYKGWTEDARLADEITR